MSNRPIAGHLYLDRQFMTVVSGWQRHWRSARLPYSAVDRSSTCSGPCVDWRTIDFGRKRSGTRLWRYSGIGTLSLCKRWSTIPLSRQVKIKKYKIWNNCMFAHFACFTATAIGITGGRRPEQQPCRVVKKPAVSTAGRHSGSRQAADDAAEDVRRPCLDRRRRLRCLPVRTRLCTWRSARQLAREVHRQHWWPANQHDSAVRQRWGDVS